MTNKEAIKWLESIDKKYIYGGDEWYDEQRHEAIKTAIKALEETPTDEWIETKHRLNLLIGVLYSNHCISECDINYIEDSIKKLMKGSAE